MNEKKIHDQAERYFLASCGMNQRKSNTGKMQEAGLKAWYKIEDNIKIKGVFLGTDRFALHRNRLSIENVDLKCNVLEHIDASAVEKVYPYVVTSGEYRSDTEVLSEMYYADAWGSAYVEAARESIGEMIKEENAGKFVFGSFGPGYFGMPVEEVEKFFSILNCKAIGVSYNDNGLMIPIKTLAGIYLVMNRSVESDIRDCESCIGDKTGCEFCSVNKKRREVEYVRKPENL